MGWWTTVKGFWLILSIVCIMVVLAGCGGGGSSGSISTPSPVCGNNKVESGEHCDDGNTTSNDGCSSECKIGFSKIFGGDDRDYAESINQTSNGGYIIAGRTESTDGESKNCWVINIDKEGDLVWDKILDGNNRDYCYEARQTSDGGYIVAGYTTTVSSGSSDFWVVKLNSAGNTEWEKTFDRNGDGDYGKGIIQTSDSGYIVVGVSSDLWVIKVDENGNQDWNKLISVSTDHVMSVQQTSDGGFVVAGGDGDFRIHKLNSSGELEWDKSYGGDGRDYAFSVDQTEEGGYIVAGYTESYDEGGVSDFWVLKLDSNGNMTWNKTFGGSGIDGAYSIKQTSDGGYIVAGGTRSNGYNLWLIKLDSNGNMQWDKTYGDYCEDVAKSIQQISNGGFIIAGFNGKEYSCLSDIWILKLDSEGSCNGCVFE